MESLMSLQNMVESPFIIVKIGDYTFGHCSNTGGSTMSVTFPNFMKSLNITKISGAVNTYTLKMEYAITQFDDPNMLEKVFSSVNKTRKITLTYGDWNAPSSIYKEEEALMTKVTSSVNFNQSKIEYTISCVSTALSLTAGSYSFGARTAKPSDVIRELISNTAYGLSNIFPGTAAQLGSRVSNLIASDDKVVRIEAKESTNLLDYMNYLVTCMEDQNETDSTVKNSNYRWAVCDDTKNQYGGAYFQVSKISSPDSSIVVPSATTYEVDVGYPNNSYVVDFNINTDNTWALLYDYSTSIQQPEYQYSIDANGKVITTKSPSLTRTSEYLKTTETSKSWWTQMTKFPITARLTIKGLLRPAVLMSEVKVNSFFYGHKHISTGTYIITKQEDTIDSRGYRTVLSLTRVKGDE